MPITIPFLAQFARSPHKPNQSKNSQQVPNLPPPSTRFTEVKDETTDDQ